MKHRYPHEPIRMAFIHRSERRMRETFMRLVSPPLLVTTGEIDDILYNMKLPWIIEPRGSEKPPFFKRTSP